jgi:hypothetical protein
VSSDDVRLLLLFTLLKSSLVLGDEGCDRPGMTIGVEFVKLVLVAGVAVPDAEELRLRDTNTSYFFFNRRLLSFNSLSISVGISQVRSRPIIFKFVNFA